ncbi:MAG: hypothetical protein COB17_09375 [Sulfurimonas sp.]|nr:MAG: hypothetical protein COB17_09375 [Sulfurimonas sp.]
MKISYFGSSVNIINSLFCKIYLFKGKTYSFDIQWKNKLYFFKKIESKIETQEFFNIHQVSADMAKEYIDSKYNKNISKLIKPYYYNEYAKKIVTLLSSYSDYLNLNISKKCKFYVFEDNNLLDFLKSKGYLKDDSIINISSNIHYIVKPIIFLIQLVVMSSAIFYLRFKKVNKPRNIFFQDINSFFEKKNLFPISQDIKKNISYWSYDIQDKAENIFIRKNRIYGLENLFKYYKLFYKFSFIYDDVNLHLLVSGFKYVSLNSQFDFDIYWSRTDVTHAVERYVLAEYNRKNIVITWSDLINNLVISQFINHNYLFVWSEYVVKHHYRYNDCEKVFISGSPLLNKKVDNKSINIEKNILITFNSFNVQTPTHKDKDFENFLIFLEKCINNLVKMDLKFKGKSDISIKYYREVLFGSSLDRFNKLIKNNTIVNNNENISTALYKYDTVISFGPSSASSLAILERKKAYYFTNGMYKGSPVYKYKDILWFDDPSTMYKVLIEDKYRFTLDKKDISKIAVDIDSIDLINKSIISIINDFKEIK